MKIFDTSTPHRRSERTYFDRRKLRDLIPWDTDQEMMRCMKGDTSAQFKSDLALYLNSLGTAKEIGQNALSACFEDRYLRNHIWDDHKVR